MYIPQSPAELRRVIFLRLTSIEPGADTSCNRDSKPARDVVPGECWVFSDHRTLAELIAEDLV
jgi:hypothetical protein